ncbi:MAG: aldehyde dehydrogenase family protein [Planctomycetes bacterium]|nr:aldehyde dehydrogenase family protein [Planctomycetota bacterium]
MRMFIRGQWKEKAERIDVLNPYDGAVIETVPRADWGDVEEALAGAVEGAAVMAKVPAHDRFRMLERAARLLDERKEDFARTISLEEGKIIAEGRMEAGRAGEIFQIAAEESKRILGEVLPMDAAPGGAGKFGFTIRVPCGVVLAITPFNFPLHLVCHKVAPALAAGNSVVIKPASDTPLSALKLVEVLLEAGVPPLAIACITGSGAALGDALCGDERVRKISFTGSYEVGDHVCRAAGMKRVTMELGSNSPLIVMDDADIAKVVDATVATGYANAGQVCISAQRVLVDSKVYGDYIDALKPRVEALTTGDQLKETTRVGPMVREADAVRVKGWIDEAVAQGARLVTGGERRGTIVQPAVVSEVTPEMRLWGSELFGPAVGVRRCRGVDEAIALANDTRYGLSAGVFTRDIDRALRFAREVSSGNIHINWGPQWRVDLMPYGGLKRSGMGKEGPRYAIEEMTETKMVVVHMGS